MKALILIFLSSLLFNASAVVYCGCDDDENALMSEKQSADDMGDHYEDMTASIAISTAMYKLVEKAMDTALVAEAKAVTTASRLKDSIGAKETMEALSAKATLDGADINTVGSINIIKAKIGLEAENLEAIGKVK